MPAKVSADGFAKKYLKDEAKGKVWLGKLVPELQPLSQEMLTAYSDGPSLNARDRKAFVRNFVGDKAKGSIWLSLLLPLLIPILQRLLEAFLQREAA